MFAVERFFSRVLETYRLLILIRTEPAFISVSNVFLNGHKKLIQILVGKNPMRIVFIKCGNGKVPSIKVI